jgi:hypothetical protein
MPDEGKKLMCESQLIDVLDIMVEAWDTSNKQSTEIRLPGANKSIKYPDHPLVFSMRLLLLV